MVRVLRLEEVEPIDVAGVHWLPVRKALGVTAFGVNAYTANTQQPIIERHDETGHGSGGHEEMYVVVHGRAQFVVDGREIDAPAGTCVFLPDPTAKREAKAMRDGTLILALGGRPGAAGGPSPWEFYFAAAPFLKSDPAHAYAVAAEGLPLYPENPSMQYNLACYAALAGEREKALEHLLRAVELEPKCREWARDDGDLDSLRDDPRFPAAT